MLHRFWQARKRPIVLAAITLAAILWAVMLARQTRFRQAQQHIDAGIEAIRAGQSHDAEREWVEAARLTPDNADLWELLSTLYINTEQWSKGLYALQHLQRVAPNRPYLYSRMAACALRTGNEIEAQRLALLELKQNPGDEASLTIMAFLSSMQQDSAQQISYLQRLLARHPKNSDTLHDLAQAYYDADRFSEVLPTTDALMAVRPNDGLGYSLRGAARYALDATPAASAQSEADRYMLGRVYLREGQFQKAIFQLELAQKLYPRKMDVPFELAVAYARMGQPAKAAAAQQRFETLRQEATQIAVLQKHCVVDHNDFAGHLQLGRIMLQNGDLRQSYYYIQRALVLNPHSSEAKAVYKQLATQLNNQAHDLPH
jgi:Flp pilus assembly protein TadD